MDKKAIQAAIDEIITNQIANDDPPETAKTLARLLKEGWSNENARKLIGQCVISELFSVAKHNQVYDEKRYVKNLRNLPKEPFEI